jgi:hypothetical protein
MFFKNFRLLRFLFSRAFSKDKMRKTDLKSEYNIRKSSKALKHRNLKNLTVFQNSNCELAVKKNHAKNICDTQLTSWKKFS